MCYSAMVEQKLKSLGLRYQARVDLSLFDLAFRRRLEGEKIGLSRGLEFNFRNPTSPDEKRIQASIEDFNTQQIKKTEQDLFTQKKRIADAERKLKVKPTKTAEKERDTALRQIERFKRKIEKLSSAELTENDSRIYAFDWAPVIIWREGARVIVPMRYHLRPPGASEDFDRKYPGCYNARRDSLTGFWRREFGKKHAALIISGFFENVKRHDYEKRSLNPGEIEENRILHFTPSGHEQMIVPCLWDHWGAPGQAGLDSFALITDEPPPEIAETGHGRCPIFLKEGHLNEWLNPNGKTDEQLFALLDGRERPRYQHAIAA